MEILLDTCVFSPFFSKNGPSIEIVALMASFENLSISSVTHFEVQAGLRAAGLINALNTYPLILKKLRLTIYDFDKDMAEIAAIQCGKLKSLGRSYTMQDLWIGATAKAKGIGLATRNIKDFDHWDIELKNPHLPSKS